MVIRPSAALVTVLGSAAFLPGGIALAQVTTEFTPGIFAGITYTDNLRLQADDEKLEQLTYLVTPEFSFSRAGPRMQTTLDYRAQAIFYEEDVRDDSILNFLRFNNSATLVENRLFLDLESNITQQILDPAEAIPSSGINDAGNRSEVLTAFATPRWQATIGNFAQSSLSYRGGIVEYKEPQLRDSKEYRWDYALNGFVGRNSSWLLSYYDSRADYDSGEEVSLATATAELGIGIGAKTSLVLSGGLDSNSFSGPAGTRDIEDEFWLVGLRGTLGRFTQYDIRGGERFFGTTYSMNLSRERGNLVAEVDYSEGVTSVGQAQIDYQSLFNFISQITGVDDITGIELPVALPSAYVRKRLQVSATYQLPASSVQLAVFSENREYLDALRPGDEDKTRGAALNYRWTAGARTSFNVDLTWRAFDLRNAPDSPEDTRLRARVRREFGADYAMNFTVWRNQRGAVGEGGGFTENAASLGFTKQF